MKVELSKAVAAVMSEIVRLKKADENKHGQYKYVSVDDIKDLVRPLLAKNGLSLSMTELSYSLETLQMRNGASVNAKITYEFRLRHISGEEDEPERITILLPQTGAQTSGAAKSYAIKEYSKARFFVSTGEKDMIDGGADADAFKPQEYTEAPEPPPEPPKAYDRNPIVRQEFMRLQKGVREIADMGTLEDLAFYWKNNQDNIKSLPADWKVELQQTKDQTKEALMAKVPA